MSSQIGNEVGERLKFGEFELVPAARSLGRRGEEIKLGSRALDILIALASRPGQIVSKDDLTHLVWHGAEIDETALRVGISQVRKALGNGGGNGGDRIIATIPGRGYCFVLDVETSATQPTPEHPPLKRLKPLRLPAQIARIVGRDAVIAALAAETTRRRLVSLVGTGGIGKTTVAIAVADRLRSAFDAVGFVDFSPIETEAQMSAAAAAALGLSLRPQENPVDEIALAFADRRVLIVLDNCEHVVGLAAAFGEALLGRAPGVTLLATSRERLRAAGEWVHHLAPLDAPENSARSVDEVRTYPAVALFEDRAAFALGGYRITDADAAHVAEICRRLDGVALAIELAAGRLAGMGVQGLASSLEDCFSILTHGRRTALERHQTLRATLDWSYRLLSGEDQAALRSLSVFSGSFTVEDAAMVMGRFAEASERLTSLLEKSLVAARPDDGRVRYRLLDTTRAYAQGKLGESGEADLRRRRHAQRFLELCRAAAPDEQRQAALRLAIADIRAALDWSLARGGDTSLGVDLAASATPVFLRFSLLKEHRRHLDLALAQISIRADTVPMGEAGLRSEMALRMAAVLASYYAEGHELVPEKQLQRAREIAQTIGDRTEELKVLWMLYGWAGNVGDYRQELLYARSFVAAARAPEDPTTRSRCNRMLARGLSHLGQHDCAQKHIELALQSARAAMPRVHVHAYDADDGIAARAIYARILWLRGYPDDAKAEAEQCLAEALRMGQDQSICWTIAFNLGPVALWRGDVAYAETLVGLLLERSQIAFEHYHEWGLVYRQFLDGAIAEPNRVDSVCDSKLKATLPAQADLFATFDPAFAGPDSLARAEADEDIWCAPEILRAQACRLVALSDRTAGETAEALLRRSLGLSKRHGAKAWELRAATSLALLYSRMSRSHKARAALEPALEQFKQGHDTRDVRVAISVLSTLSS